MRLPAGRPILTAAAMRATEERAFAAGVSQAALMARAGGAVAREAARFAAGRPILILAGPGNNGGDAYVAARWLRERGHDVTVARLGEPREGAAEAAALAWGHDVTPLDAVDPRPVLIDGLFGIGLTRPLDAAVAEPFARLLAAAEFTLAIDLPSGLATDSGTRLGLPQPFDATLALGALKPAHTLALDQCGHALLDDLGLDVASDWRTIARPVIAAPGPDQHKYRSCVLVVAGTMPGAARLAARGAAGAGAGYVVLAGADAPRDSVVTTSLASPHDLPSLAHERRATALVLGPGLGRNEAARALIDAAIGTPLPLVLDGDALSGPDLIAQVSGRSAPTILTPHSGEFDSVFGGSADDRITRTIAAAAAANATVVHKGATTIVAHPSGKVTLAAGGSGWLATAGTGDVLAGATAARIGGGGTAEEAVWLHARAAALAGPAFDADTLAETLPRAVAECR